MLLKEFQLTSDQKPINSRVPFHSQVRGTMALFEYHFPRFETDDIWKVCFSFSRTLDEPELLDGCGLVEVDMPLDIGNFYDLEPLQKKQRALEILLQGLEYVTSEMKWDKAPFEEAAEEVRKAEFNNHWEHCSKWNRSRTHRAFLHCEHEPEQFTGYLCIENKQGERIETLEVIQDYPSEDCFWKKLGDIKWVDNTSLQLLDRGKSVIKQMELSL